MYSSFGLVLMVTHACNLRCDYCYLGKKRCTAMPPEIARAAIERAANSIVPGGTLHLGFFGGEPLLEARMILEAVAHARRAAAARSLDLRLALTTNGTINSADAWRVLELPEMEVSVSHDGLPKIHDRHRRDGRQQGTSARVLSTLRVLIDRGQDPTVVMVVRPDTVRLLPQGIVFLRDLGVRHVEPNLDLWTAWKGEDAAALQEAIAAAAEVWAAGLPAFDVGWFVDKTARLTGMRMDLSPRCGFGDGELAVAPSGRLYPCERLIGDDRGDHPLQLPGHAMEGRDFSFPPSASRNSPACTRCGIEAACNTTCRCSNYVRTGDVTRPDRLLCLLEQACCREAARVLAGLPSGSLPVLSP